MKQWSKRLGFLFILLLAGLCLQHVDTSAANEPGKLTVTFLYVGQGDCILLQSEGQSMLIDAGKAEYGANVVSYLKKIGVTSLNYAIVTHDDPDHIGGFNSVLKKISVEKIYHTGVRYNDNANSKNANDLIKSLNIHTEVPFTGSTMQFGCATIEFLAPNSNTYSEYNDNSIVVRVVNGENSFLLTGDAELASENEMLSKGRTLKSDVLKVGHHSALTSTSQKFLDAVDPSISVISCDEAGAAGFPRKTTVAKLTKTNIYRTDISGNIVFESDGKDITTSADPYLYANSSYKNGQTTQTLEDECKVLKNPDVMSDYEEMSLHKIMDDDDFGLIITEPLTMQFEANSGITKMDSIEYALVGADQTPDMNQMDWVRAKNGEVTLKNDFAGLLYVKFENELGNIIIRKTTGFQLDCKAPSKCKVSSNIRNMKLLKTSAANSYQRYTSDDCNPVFRFSCDYGISGKGTIEYMLVPRGDVFHADSIWEEGSSVTVEKNFTGRIYVRYTDGAGNTVTYKTQGFTWISGNPTNFVTASNVNGVKLVGVSKDAKKVVSKSQVKLSFSAEFGHGGKKAIRYQLVPKGKKYNAKGKWITASSLALKKGFTGRVYVKFVDRSGRCAVRRTNYIKIIKNK